MNMLPDIMNYNQKTDHYFHGERRDFVDKLAGKKLRFLEIGCGNGATARYARSVGCVEHYVGVEIFEDAACLARSSVDRVIVGDIEKVDLDEDLGPFDVLIMSEVLEHLVDPWSVLRRIRPRLSRDADVFASSPSVSHHRILRMMLNGEWNLADSGPMDRTHLRWFTPSSYSEMFKQCGYDVRSSDSMTGLSWKGKILDKILPSRYRHVLVGQIKIHAKPN